MAAGSKVRYIGPRGIPLATEIPDFYPDLIACGGLANAVRAAFGRLGSPLQVAEPPSPIVYASVGSATALSVIYIGAERRMLVFGLWRHGVGLANGASPEIPEVARAIDAWIRNGPSTGELASEFPFVVPSPDATVYERGEEVEVKWQRYLARGGGMERRLQLLPFVAAAAAEPRLRQLFPFMSMYTFRFSRCTGFPFTGDTPYVRWCGGTVYEVISRSGQSLGRGTAAEAVALVVAALPPDCGPAVRGTADDLAVECFSVRSRS